MTVCDLVGNYAQFQTKSYTEICLLKNKAEAIFAM